VNSSQDYQDEYDDISEQENALNERELAKLNRQLEQASQDILKDTERSRATDANTEQEETNYYKENIFNKEDYYLYRAVMYFYAGDYEKALGDFEQSSQIMHS
jgi:tetratricopeptide (TPR) repeat protein